MMDISDKVKQDDKVKVANLTLECQVLQNILNEHKADLQAIMGRVLRENTNNPTLYGIKAMAGKWEMFLKEGSLAMPAPQLNRAERRALLKD